MPSTRSTRRSLAALAATAVLFLGACGSDDGDDAAGNSTTAVDATTTTAAEGEETTTSEGDDTVETTAPDDTTDTTDTTESTGETPAGEATFVSDLASTLVGQLAENEDDANCLAQAWVDIVGYDRIADAGATAEDLGGGSSEDWAGLEVTDDEADQLYDALDGCGLDIRQTFIDAFSEGSPEARSCVEGALTEDLARESVRNTFLGEDDPDSLTEGLKACVPDA